MRRTVEKTIVAKIKTDELTQAKQDAINREYDAYQDYVHGDDSADLYSATKQAADKYTPDDIENGREYPWHLRNDVISTGHDLQKHDTELTSWWLKIPVSTVYGGVNAPIHPHEDLPDDASLNDSKIIRDNGDYYAHLTVQVERDVQEVYDDVIGVDFGVRWVATAVLLSDRSTRFYDKNIRSKRRHFARLRSTLQEKSAYDTLSSVRESEHNFVDDKLHKITREIVDWAIEENALIVVGDLEGISDSEKGAEMNRRLHSMPHYTLKQYLAYKAAWAGVEVVEVNEYMTSQTCNWCGEQSDTARERQGLFECGSCGLEDNADKNGALNIAKRGLGKNIRLGLRSESDFPLSSLGAMNELALEPSDGDDTSASESPVSVGEEVRVRVNLETPSSTSESIGRAK